VTVEQPPPAAVGHGVGRPGAATTSDEQLQCRNYDHDRGYDLTVTLQRDGTCALARRYHLQPGAVRCLGDLVPAGTWTVVVTLDGGAPRRATCTIGPNPDETAVVECGNGALAVSQRG
jgi:hypothetical protein